MKVFFTLLFVWLLGSTALWGQPADVVWNSQSRNSSGSMPCGGGDIGMNVWVEDDDVFFYLCRSGSFDENNTLLKQGRFRIRLTPNPFAGRSDFRQTLHLKTDMCPSLPRWGRCIFGRMCSILWCMWRWKPRK